MHRSFPEDRRLDPRPILQRLKSHRDSSFLGHEVSTHIEAEADLELCMAQECRFGLASITITPSGRRHHHRLFLHPYAAPRRDSRWSASATARGLRAATRSRARAGPSGVRRPCSQLRNVATLTPIMRANCVCDALSFSRMLFTSAGRNMVTRAGLSRPRRILPACLILLNSS